MNARSRFAIALGLTLGLVAGSAALSQASAYTETVKYDFCSSSGCSDGPTPQAQLLKSGHFLYGTAGGGAHGHGMAFQYATSTSTYTVLYSFCSSTWALTGTCKDGDSPSTRL